jgi:K+-sensing histidine kinase KdpD
MATDAVDVECACLNHTGIFDAWLGTRAPITPPADDDADAHVSTLCAGENDVSVEFQNHVKSRFRKVARQFQADQNAIALRNAESQHRMRSAMMGQVGHDLGNLLHVVMGNVELFRENIITGEKLANVVTSQSTFLLHNVHNLVDLHRLDSDALQVQESVVSVRDAVGEVCGWYSGFAENRKKPVQNLCKDKPDLFVVADTMLLKRVVANLIDNAVKYISPGQTVFVEAEDEGAMINLRVRDNGPGMTAETLSRVFEDWYRDGNDRASGFGLGLPASRRITELMQGTLEAESVAGEGATFHVRLPKADGPEQPTESTASQSRAKRSRRS